MIRPSGETLTSANAPMARRKPRWGSFRVKSIPWLLMISFQRGVNRWNEIIKSHGIDFTLTLPHRGFRRAIGAFAEVKVSPDGRIISEAEWDARHRDWLPTEEDEAYVASLMQGVTERGNVAGWIAPPARGINSQPTDFEYVRLG